MNPARKLFTTTKYLKIIITGHQRLLARNILGDHMKDLNEGTLTGRLLTYLNEKQQLTPNIMKLQPEALKSIKYKPSKIKELKNEEILNILKQLTQAENKTPYQNLLHTIDTELEERLVMLRLTNSEIIKLLSSYMTLVSNKMTTMKFFKAVLREMSSQQFQDKNDLIQFIFYVGLLKKSELSQRILKYCLKQLDKAFIDDLSSEDMCIICNSFFKTSTKISNKYFLNKCKSFINEDLKVLNDPQVFITLVKTIRHNRCQDEDLLETIICTIQFNKLIDEYNFAALCHILALFADYSYYDESFIRLLYNRCITLLKDTCFLSKRANVEEQLRGKDLKRFLWSLSNLSFVVPRKDVQEVIEPKILETYDKNGFDKDFDSLIDIFLYLWMLNYKSDKLMPIVFNRNKLLAVLGSASATKQRLNLLLSCLYFKDKNLFKKLGIKPNLSSLLTYDNNIQVKRRPVLERVYNALQTVSKSQDINKFELESQIPFLNIVGIVGYQKKLYKAVHIEVLDEFTSLRKANEPNGLMNLKLKLLEEGDEGLIIVESWRIQEMTENELEKHLSEELEFVC